MFYPEMCLQKLYLSFTSHLITLLSLRHYDFLGLASWGLFEAMWKISQKTEVGMEDVRTKKDNIMQLEQKKT